MVNNKQSVDVYITHSKTLATRGESVSNISTKLQSYDYQNMSLGKINVIQTNDPNDIQLNIIQQIIDYTKIDDVALAPFNQFIKNIHINQLSHTLKHLDAYQQMARSTATLNLVLEDDVLFSEDVCSKLDETVGLMDLTTAQITFLGLPQKPDATLALEKCDPNSLIPLTDAYFIPKGTATILSLNYLPIKFVNMVQLNYLIKKLNIQAYQTTKSLFINGSRYGSFVSSLNPNNSLVFNSDYMSVIDLMKQSTIDEEKVMTIYNSSVIKNSPDFMHLIAKVKASCGKYKEAEKLYTDAYNIALTNGAIVNHESALLKDFIRVWKHLQ